MVEAQLKVNQLRAAKPLPDQAAYWELAYFPGNEEKRFVEAID